MEVIPLALMTAVKSSNWNTYRAYNLGIKEQIVETIGYSKLGEMHDKVISTFIEREYYILYGI
ncbi:hypothetical protein XNC3_2500045 [Xenorhabdus nematophila F1]|nr:hypothetical protein LH67_15880 [Xenorhabdus nematophila]CCW31271.1 hypothetical protein XNC3_2500045 [Xenorhabdus nematophila F1]CEE91678.1 hypothetical protein XNA1_2330003 [Xenorhabdus nematophila str. Anatoliense]CEE95540.1 hypothetical protein XNA1_550003 [Xenorhabdus nematophila str. Anatoliense]CEF29539.1 hypothetical protein XNW1_1860007 [Xenorhabdus nematophila str. Websteri]